jgi:hypothetical protein
VPVFIGDDMKTPNYDFDKDLPVAKKTEDQISKFLSETQGFKFVATIDDLIKKDPRNYTRKDFDLLMEKNNNKIRIEVKEDFTCERTGNVGVEFECRGKDSGIRTTKSDYYLYKVHMPNKKIGVYVIPTNNLRKMIEDKNYFRIVNGGDVGSNSMNYLFKLDVIKQNFKFLGYLEN